MTNQLNRLQQYISKASFAHSADKNAALELAAGLGGTPSGRAEELITQLEEEIVRRDARIAELEEERNRLLNNPKDVFKKMCDMALKQRDEFAAELAALKAQPSGVVLPHRRLYFQSDDIRADGHCEGWNACLDEVARLNPCRAQAVPEGWPEQWKREGYNGCVKTAVDALRFLRTNRPPAGGEQRYNDMHLMQIADDLETTMRKLLAAAPSAKKGCTKPGCFPYCDCGSIDDAQSARQKESDDEPA